VPPEAAALKRSRAIMPTMPVKRVKPTAAGTWLLLSLVGCGGGSGTKSTITQPGDFVANFVDVYCGWEARCNLSPDKVTCSNSLLSREEIVALDQAIRAGRVTVDASTSFACLNALSALACSQAALATLNAGSGISCQTLLQGHVSAGGACLIDNECAGGGHCQASNCTGLSCCVGVCQAPLGSGRVGASCSSSRDCAVSNYCYYDAAPGAAPWTCQSRLSQGQACSSDGGCVAGLDCLGPTDSKVCAPYVQDGRTCFPNDFMPCDNPAGYCDPTDNLCKPKVAVGHSCSGSSCVGYATCDNGICKAKPVSGESCTVPDGGSDLTTCLDGACVAGICTTAPADVSCIDG